jgi:hypothetical protein
VARSMANWGRFDENRFGRNLRIKPNLVKFCV